MIILFPSIPERADNPRSRVNNAGVSVLWFGEVYHLGLRYHSHANRERGLGPD
jgi:hypothetical protein